MKVLNGPELFCFARFSQSIFQTCGNIKMVFDNAFAEVGDDQDIGDTLGDRFFDDVLDRGLSTIVSISLGMDYVAGITAFVIFMMTLPFLLF